MDKISKHQRQLHRPTLKTLLQGSLGSKPMRNVAMAQAYLEHGYALAEIGKEVGLQYATISHWRWCWARTPMLQKHMVDLPPALILTMQILLGVLVGILGVILSVPLTAAAMVMVKIWYVEDILEGNRQQAGAPA